MIEQLKAEYPIQVICDVIGYSRSRYYYRSTSDKPSQEEELKKGIRQVWVAKLSRITIKAIIPRSDSA